MFSWFLRTQMGAWLVGVMWGLVAGGAETAGSAFGCVKFFCLFEFGGDLRTMPAQGNMAAAIENAEGFARAVYARLAAEEQ